MKERNRAMLFGAERGSHEPSLFTVVAVTAVVSGIISTLLFSIALYFTVMHLFRRYGLHTADEIASELVRILVYWCGRSVSHKRKRNVPTCDVVVVESAKGNNRTGVCCSSSSDAHLPSNGYTHADESSHDAEETPQPAKTQNGVVDAIDMSAHVCSCPAAEAHADRVGALPIGASVPHEHDEAPAISTECTATLPRETNISHPMTCCRHHLRPARTPSQMSCSNRGGGGDTLSYAGVEQILLRNNYRILRLIGRGSFASVYLVECTHTRRQYALKYIACRNNSDRLLALKECETLILLQGHPCVVTLVDMFMGYQFTRRSRPHGTAVRHAQQQHGEYSRHSFTNHTAAEAEANMDVVPVCVSASQAATQHSSYSVNGTRNDVSRDRHDYAVHHGLNRECNYPTVGTGAHILGRAATTNPANVHSVPSSEQSGYSAVCHSASGRVDRANMVNTDRMHHVGVRATDTTVADGDDVASLFPAARQRRNALSHLPAETRPGVAHRISQTEGGAYTPNEDDTSGDTHDITDSEHLTKDAPHSGSGVGNTACIFQYGQAELTAYPQTFYAPRYGVRYTDKIYQANHSPHMSDVPTGVAQSNEASIYLDEKAMETYRDEESEVEQDIPSPMGSRSHCAERRGSSFNHTSSGEVGGYHPCVASSLAARTVSVGPFPLAPSSMSPTGLTCFPDLSPIGHSMAVNCTACVHAVDSSPKPFAYSYRNFCHPSYVAQSSTKLTSSKSSSSSEGSAVRSGDAVHATDRVVVNDVEEGRAMDNKSSPTEKQSRASAAVVSRRDDARIDINKSLSETCHAGKTSALLSDTDRRNDVTDMCAKPAACVGVNRDCCEEVHNSTESSGRSSTSIGRDADDKQPVCKYDNNDKGGASAGGRSRRSISSDVDVSWTQKRPVNAMTAMTASQHATTPTECSGFVSLVMEYHPLCDLAHYVRANTRHHRQLSETVPPVVNATNITRGCSDVAQTNNALTEVQLLSIAQQLSSALYFLHTRQPPVIHRDLKPENILIRASPHDPRSALKANHAAPYRECPSASNGVVADEGKSGLDLCLEAKPAEQKKEEEEVSIGASTHSDPPSRMGGLEGESLVRVASAPARATPAEAAARVKASAHISSVNVSTDTLAAASASVPKFGGYSFSCAANHANGSTPMSVSFATTESSLTQSIHAFLSCRVNSKIIPICLTDFGLAIREERHLRPGRGGGTRPYVAPEVWRGETCTASDMWSLGCVLYALTTARLTERTVRVMYLEAERPDFSRMILDDILSHNYSLMFATLVLSLLVVDPTKRLSADVARRCFMVRDGEVSFDPNSPFFTNVLDL